MKKGEKAVFTIRSDYAYGAEGSGDKIPGPPPPSFVSRQGRELPCMNPPTTARRLLWAES